MNELVAARVKVGIVDDHLIVRQALRQFLTQHNDIDVVGESSTGRGAIELARTVAMHVMVLDISMPDKSGVDALAYIQARAPQMGILILSSHPAEKYAISMIRQGAKGYLNKQCTPEDILSAVRTIGSGRRYFQPELAELLIHNASAEPGQGKPPHESLTAREFQVLMKLAAGGTARAIGEELSLSAKTVSTYRCNVLAKLDLRTNSELTHYVIKHRLVD